MRRSGGWAGDGLAVVEDALRVVGCLPPMVSVPKPGPCRGRRRGSGSAGRAVKVVRRAVAGPDPGPSSKVGRAQAARAQVIALADGRKVDIDKRELGDLLDALESAPPVNLANLQVQDEPNMFRRHLRDIPRDKMPAMPGNVADLGGLLSELERRGVTSELVELDPREIVATQSELSGPKVAAMTKFMRGGWKPGWAVIVSRENALADGHHRWAGAASAALLHEQGVPGYQAVRPKVLRVDLPIDDLLKLMQQFSGPRKGLKS